MLLLRKELKRVEGIEAFWIFVQDGVEHIRQNGGSARDPNDSKTTVELSANTISKMEVKNPIQFILHVFFHHIKSDI